MATNEDEIPSEYPYSWRKADDEAERPLDEYLKKCRPSMVQNDGTKPWIWVARDVSEAKEGLLPAVTEAKELLDATTKRVGDIQNDASIPTRSNKKKGTKSKKEVREEVQMEAGAKLKEISLKHSYCTGKWLMFAGGDKVDLVWSNLARSLVSGPLSTTDAYCAKVSTSPKEETPNYQHVICLYMPNVYDKDSVTEALKVLLRNHGMNVTGVKSDLYTLIGIKSKHPSGMPSTVFKPTDLMKDSEIKELREAFFGGLKKSPSVTKETKAEAKDASKVVDSEDATKPKPKAKPKLKKKVANEDPFGSDSDAGDSPLMNESKAARKDKKNATKTRKRTREDSDSEDDVKPRTKSKKTSKE